MADEKGLEKQMEDLANEKRISNAQELWVQEKKQNIKGATPHLAKKVLDRIKGTQKKK